MKRIVICLLCVMLLCGCTFTSDTKITEKPTIVATNFPLYDFARAICGEKANIKMLIKPGTEVHSYDPLPSDMRAVFDSDLFLYIGGESDKWADKLINSGNVNAAALLHCAEHSHEHHGHNHADEHIWTSSKNAVFMLEEICENIIKIDAENTDYYRKNCDAYITSIENISREIESLVKSKSNPFIMVADRFPFVYFAEQYGIEYESAFDGCAVSTDISLKTMSRLSKTIKQRSIKSVFCTELSNRNIADALKKEHGVQVLELHSAHNVSLSDFENNVTYVDIMKRNKEALERGL